MEHMVNLRDGCYIVDHGTIYAAFVVRRGKVTQCAPVLRKRFDYLVRFATWIPTNLDIRPVKETKIPA
jgi:hypothetical protein